MGIDVALVTDTGRWIESISDARNLLHHLLPSIGDPDFIHLGCVDWNGDTVSNSLQIPRLLEELERLKQSARTDDERALLNGISQLAKKCRDDVHTYVKFVGD